MMTANCKIGDAEEGPVGRASCNNKLEMLPLDGDRDRYVPLVRDIMC